jgi:SOS-response transcriptional repressor LexA
MISVSQNDLLKYIIQYKQAHDGNSPTYQEMIDTLGISSKSVVKYMLVDLQRAGRIRLVGGSKSRSIEVIGGRWIYKKQSQPEG